MPTTEEKMVARLLARWLLSFWTFAGETPGPACGGKATDGYREVLDATKRRSDEGSFAYPWLVLVFGKTHDSSVTSAR